jgi:hypothetical protein
MMRKPGKVAIAKHLVELRREALAALRRFNVMVEQLNFYEQYLALSKHYDVRLAGPFLVIKGGKPTERLGLEQNSSTLREVQ